MALRNPYHSLPHLAMRFPRYPLGMVLNALSDSDHLMSILNTEDFKNAILFASPALYEELKKFLTGNTSSKERKKVQLAALKYLTRMSTRCTPFASMASCACVSWGCDTNISPKVERIERYRLDMLYICILIEKILREHAIRTRLKYKTNSTVYRSGKYLRYISYYSHGLGRTFRICETKDTRPLRLLVRNAECYIGFNDLLEILMHQFELEKEKAIQYLHTLIDAQLLVSELDPFVIGDELLVYVADKLKDKDDAWHSYLNELISLIQCLSSKEDVEKNEDIYGKIRSKLESKGIKVNSKYLIQLDTFSQLYDGEISRRVMKTVRQGLEFLSRVVPVTNNFSLQQFRQRFSTRYQDQEIPLLEALDPDIGIGYILSQDRVSNPLVDNIRLPAKTSQTSTLTITPLQRILMQKVSQHNWAKSNCIEITDEDVEHLQPVYQDLPVSMSAMFELIVNSDGHQLCELRFSGTTAANLLGRFAYGDDGIKEIVDEVARHEQDNSGDAILAEIAHIPQSRTGNILFRPHIYDYEIAYMCNSLLKEKNIIPASDLLVSVKNNRIVLRSKRLGNEVIPRLTTAHNYSGTDTSPVYRFLCDMQHQYGRTSLSFLWGALSSIDHLPRVVYRNIILSRERWIVKKKQLPFKKNDFDSIKWQQWKAGISLPRYVMLVFGDNKLMVDTDNRLSVETMLSEIGNIDQFFLEEFMPHWPKEEKMADYFMNECVVPLIKTQND